MYKLQHYIRKNLLFSVGLVIISSIVIFVLWLLFFTPFPVYLLDKLNLRPFFLPNIKCNRCNNFTYNFIVPNKNYCGSEDIFLLIMVASYHPNVDARKAIRKTWGSVSHHKGLVIKTVFIFGTHADKNLNSQVKYELDHYGDVIQADFEDRYKTLTNKTMSGLNWVLKYCPQVHYVLKTDDDAFNVPQRYVDYLINTHLTTFIGGYCFTIMPDRSPSSKFYTPLTMYPNQHYPTYCAGPGYIMSISAIKKLVTVSVNVQYLYMEDVYVTGMCRVAADIQYQQIEGTVISKDDMTRCNVATWAKNAHNTLPQEAIRIWTENVVPSDKLKDCAYVNLKFVIYILVFLFIWCRILYNIIRKR